MSAAAREPRESADDMGDGDSSTVEVSFTQEDEGLARRALRAWNPSLSSDGDDMTAKSTAVLRALSADGDLTWLTNVGNVNEMFKRLSKCLEDLRAEARLQVQEEMDSSMAEFRKALSETVEVSSQRNQQLEVAVEAAEQAFRERDDARARLEESEQRLEEYTDRLGELETSVGEAIESAAQQADTGDQLREQLSKQRALAERYRAALSEAERRAQEAEEAHEGRAKELEAEAAAAEGEAAAQVEFLREQLAAQRAAQTSARKRHEEELAEMQQRLRAAKDKAPNKSGGGGKQAGEQPDSDKAAFWEAAERQQESLNRMWNELLERHHTDLLGSAGGSWEDSQPSPETLNEAESASLAMFHADQLRAIVQQLEGSANSTSSDAASLRTDLQSAVVQIKLSIISDTHRMAQYEAHIERLSTELMEARSQALELQQQSMGASGSEADQIEDLQRHVGLLRSKETRMEAQVAELEARLERRTAQLVAAEELAGAPGLDAQLEELRAELREATDAAQAEEQRADDLEAQLNAVRASYELREEEEGRAGISGNQRREEGLEEVSELQDALSQANKALDSLRRSSRREVEVLRTQVREKQAVEHREEESSSEVAELQEALAQANEALDSLHNNLHNSLHGSSRREVEALRRQVQEEQERRQREAEGSSQVSELQEALSQANEEMESLRNSSRREAEALRRQVREEQARRQRDEEGFAEVAELQDALSQATHELDSLRNSSRREAEALRRQVREEQTRRQREEENSAAVEELQDVLAQANEELESLRNSSRREVEALRRQVREEQSRRERVEEYYSDQVDALEKGQAGIGDADGALSGASSVAAGPSMSTPEMSRMSMQLEEMQEFRQSAEETLRDMRIQLERASDRNQELEEKTRQLTNDRDDLQDEIRKMRSSLGSSQERMQHARPDLDSAHGPALRQQSGGSRDGMPEPGAQEALGSDAVEVPSAVMRRAAEFAGDEGLARPRTASPSPVRRVMSGQAELPAPPEVLQRAALYSGDEGDTRPLTAAPSQRPDAAFGPPSDVHVAIMEEQQVVSDGFEDGDDDAEGAEEEMAEGADDQDGSGDNGTVEFVIPTGETSSGVGRGVGRVGSSSNSGVESSDLAEGWGRGSSARATTTRRSVRRPLDTPAPGDWPEASVDEQQRELQRESTVARMRHERDLDAPERGATLDEEVVMRALRRAGLVQDELRRQRTSRPQPHGRPRHEAAGVNPGRMRPVATGPRGGSITAPSAATKKKPKKKAKAATGTVRAMNLPSQPSPNPGPRPLSASARFASPARNASSRPVSAGRMPVSRPNSTGRTRRPTWLVRSLSAGRERHLYQGYTCLDELRNPAGVHTAGTNLQSEARWLYNRFNPTKVFQPHAFSSVLRSQVFNAAMRHQKPPKRSARG